MNIISKRPAVRHPLNPEDRRLLLKSLISVLIVSMLIILTTAAYIISWPVYALAADSSLKWKSEVPGSSTSAVFVMQKGDKVYLGDLAETSDGIPARHASGEEYYSLNTKAVSIGRTSGLLNAKKEGVSAVNINYGGETINAVVTVCPKTSISTYLTGRLYNTGTESVISTDAELKTLSKGFNGKISSSKCFSWVNKASSAEPILNDTLPAEGVNRLGFTSAGLLIAPNASSADSLVSRINIFKKNLSPLMSTSDYPFTVKKMTAKKNASVLRLYLKGSVKKQQILGLMLDRVNTGKGTGYGALSSGSSEITESKTFTLPVIVYDMGDINSFGEAKGHSGTAEFTSGKSTVIISLTDEYTLESGHSYRLSDFRYSDSEAQAGWTAGITAAVK